MDEELYLQVEEELEAGKKDSALWSKAKTLAKEDEKETRLQYTKLRVKQLKTKTFLKEGKNVLQGVYGIAVAAMFIYLIYVLVELYWLG